MTAASAVDELRAMTAGASDLSRALVRIADDHRARQQDWFASGGQGSWPAHSTTYTTRTDIRGHHSRTGQLLVRTGTLMRSLTQAGHRSSAVGVGASWVQIGTRASIAHLMATGEGRGDLPARPVLDVRAVTVSRWIDLLAAHVFGRDDGPDHFGA